MFIRFAAILLVALSLAFTSAPAAADDGEEFRATVTEDFTFRGCPFVPPPGTFTCGTAETDEFGPAIVDTRLTAFAPLPTGCFRDEHVTRFTFTEDKEGTLVLRILGTLCPTGGQNFVFAGTFTIAGGTGEFAGATGSGSVVASRQNGPIMGLFVGRVFEAEDEGDD